MTYSKTLTEKRDAALAKADALVAKAAEDQRELTTEEDADIAQTLEVVRDLDEQIRRHKELEERAAAAAESRKAAGVEADLDPMNPDAARIISAMKRGDLSQMSFAFRTIKDAWSDDRAVRELREVQLFDVSVVTFPAYEETVAEIRGRLLRTDEPAPTLDAKSTSVSVRKAQLALARHKK